MNVIKKLQEETGLSQYAIAKKLNVSQQLVNRYAVHGTEGMAVSRVVKWCKILEIEDFNKILTQ